jgi:hypothetical protein
MNERQRMCKKREIMMDQVQNEMNYDEAIWKEMLEKLSWSELRYLTVGLPQPVSRPRFESRISITQSKIVTNSRLHDRGVSIMASLPCQFSQIIV